MDGERLGPYLIQRELGSGGMGKVYAATVDREAAGLPPGTAVAIKVVHPQLLDAEGFFKRFLREADIGKSVAHENVVRTLDCDAVGGHHFLVMEYVEGQTLAELLNEMEVAPEELCRHVGREIAKGLAAIHAAGVIHRDLKPENVLITADHVVKVMDLGVARLQEQSLRLSRSGAFIGSVEYAAPEQFGGDVDHRCDLHALGVLLYELSCGRCPYGGDDFRQVMKAVCDEQPRRLGSIHPQLSPFFEELIHTLIAKSPGDRIASALEVHEILERGEESGWWKERAKALRTATARPLRRIRIPRETAVFGRDDEIATLLALCECAKEGEGRVALVEGEAGIGKSRLVDELIGRLRIAGEDLNFLFASYPPGGAATASGAFSAAYREHLGEEGSAAHLEGTPILVPAFDALLRGESPPSGVAELTKDSLQTCFVNATRSLAAERVTVVLIDDLHFAPDEGRALFTSLALAVPGHRILLIGTARPGISVEWSASLTRLEQTTQLELHRLGPKDLVALLSDSFQSEELAAGLCAQIAVKSDGNPFFTFEIIRGLREGQFITQREDGTWVSTQVIDEIRIPSSVLDLVKARVAGLAEDERDLLDVAACWGFEFDPLLVGDVLGLRRIPLLKKLGQIERRHRLVRASGLRYVFDHHQVQEALYGSLSELLRREYHAALARALEARTGAADGDAESVDGALAVDLCEHFLDGAQGDRVLRYLQTARTHLLVSHLEAHAAALVERALAVPGLLTGAARARTLIALVRGELQALSGRDRQEQAAREAVRLADEIGDEALRGQAALALGIALERSDHGAAEESLAIARGIALSLGDRSLETVVDESVALMRTVQGRPAEARERIERGLDFHRENGDKTGEARCEHGLANLCRATGELDEALEHCERALELSRELGDRHFVAAATSTMGFILFSQGRLREARALAERHLALCRESGLRRGEASAELCLGNVAILRRDGEQALKHHFRALEIARELNERHVEIVALGNLGTARTQQRRPSDALELQQLALEKSRAARYPAGEAVALVNIASSLRDMGETERARETAEQALRAAREIGVQYPEGYALHILGDAANDVEDTERAQSRFSEALALRRKIGHRDGIADTLIEVADLSRRGGDPAAARTALEEAIAISREQSRKDELAISFAILACLPGGDAGAAEQALADGGDSRRARLLTWHATADSAHLVEAKRRLDDALANVPDEHHEAMRRNVRVNREIMAAWSEFSADGPPAS